MAENQPATWLWPVSSWILWQIDLLITDQTMPVMTGLELARAISQVRPELPIILCSGFSDAIDDQVTAHPGIRHYFQKPVNPGLLLREIERLLAPEAERSEPPSARLAAAPVAIEADPLQ